MRLDCVLENSNCGYFIPGHDAGKYACIIKEYETIIKEEVRCSVRELATGVSKSTASKAITIHNEDSQVVNKQFGFKNYSCYELLLKILDCL
jgi:hypothetical protein